jgi:hypothetical protein
MGQSLDHATLGISAHGVLAAKGATAGQGSNHDEDEQGDKVLLVSAVPLLCYWCKINSKAV